jgi:hypothetical protein
MPWSFIVPAAISLFSGSQQADAAESAAGVAGAASDRATALQKQMFERQMAGQEPYRQAGLAGQNRLMELLGLRMPAQAGGGGVGAPYMRSDAELRNALAGQFTSEGSPGGYTGGVGREGGDGVYLGATPGVIDEAGLSRAMAAARQGDQNAMNNYQPPQGAATGQSADFGRYARDFGMSDFQQDPGYAFRLSEGQKLLDRSAAARGGLISGGALRAATRYGQDMGSQEYQNAFNRYQTNRSNQLNPLGSLMTLGQNAAANQGASMGTYGTNVGNAYMGQGDIQGNAMLAGAQARSSSYGDIANRYGRTKPNFSNMFGSSSIPLFNPDGTPTS